MRVFNAISLEYNLKYIGHYIMWFAPPPITVFKLNVCAGKYKHELISSDSLFSTESQSPDIYFSRFDIPIFDKGGLSKILNISGF